MKSDITKDNIFIEIGFSFRNHHESLICGDTFLYKKFKEENRISLSCLMVWDMV